MLLIEQTALPNGAHRNQRGNFRTVPEGWLPVMPSIEAEAVGYLPFIVIDEVEQGWITKVSQGEIPEQEPRAYIPTREQSAAAMMRMSFTAQAPEMEDEQILRCSGLAADWTAGEHAVGDIRNTRAGTESGQAWEQTWECFQAHDNRVYPDIVPGNPAWFTFWRPLHGTSPETARPFVPVQGSHDMYHTGEYMVYTDDQVYRCKSDTNFSPEDYGAAWEVYQPAEPEI